MIKKIVLRALLVLVIVLSFSLVIASPVRGAVSIDTTQVTLDVNASQVVSFPVSLDSAGTYEITIGVLSGVLTVRVAPESTSTPTPVQTPALTEAQAPALTTPVPAPTPTQTTTFKPMPPSGLETNWGLIGGIIGAVVVIAGGLGLYLARRRD